MKNTKRFTFISIAIALLLVFGISIGVYAANNNSVKVSKEFTPEDIQDEEVGVIDSIDGRTLTITLGEMEKPSDLPDFNSEEPPTDLPDFDSEDRPSDLPDFNSEEKPSDLPEFDSEDRPSDLPDFDSEDRPSDLPDFDSEDRPSDLPDFDSKDSRPDFNGDFVPEDNFQKGSETITVTVPEDIDISNLSVGDIIRFKLNDNNEIEQIFSMNDIKGNKDMNTNSKRDSNQSTEESTDSKDTISMSL